MIADFRKARALVESVQRVLDAIHANRPVDRDDAGDVCAAVKPLLNVYEDGDQTRADLSMLAMLGAFADRARAEGDAELAADVEDCAERMRVHVARGIVERLTGEKTALEQTLLASIQRNERLGGCGHVPRPGVCGGCAVTGGALDESNAKMGDIVPLHGRAGA